jgi:hypothetical protein
VIFGGDHGDVPLEATAGKVIADVVIEHPGAYVVDLSAFDSKAAEMRFAGDFLERLYRAKKRETGPLLLVVDEADVFAPQRPGPEQTRTLGALEAIVRRGRIKGLGDLLITQRAAVLNKNVLTQTEVLVVMQTTGPQDRAAIDEWIAGNGTRDERDEVLGSLASLERGEAWVWSPSSSGCSAASGSASARRSTRAGPPRSARRRSRRGRSPRSTSIDSASGSARRSSRRRRTTRPSSAARSPR